MIDLDYRGNVGVVMFNFGEEDFKGELFIIMFFVLCFCKDFIFIMINLYIFLKNIKIIIFWKLVFNLILIGYNL